MLTSSWNENQPEFTDQYDFTFFFSSIKDPSLAEWPASLALPTS